jgi:hypothetical protein
MVIGTECYVLTSGNGYHRQKLKTLTRVAIATRGMKEEEMRTVEDRRSVFEESSDLKDNLGEG